ncbi:MAG: serine/threonine protein kinase [Planctomycetes bacterium]|nr:serine/threonine protein kinase [Planctomycetota bacterium]
MQRIGIYEVVRRLGKGGMGDVYEVSHPEHSRPLAVKVLHASSPSALERFVREAELLARLRHPNVVVVHDFQLGPPPFLVTELIEGQDLAHRVAADGPWEAGRAVGVVRSLADGVAAIHLEGILHRDLKPENVILRPTGEPVLLDFGIARDESAERLTRTGALVGTPRFMSPEQVAGRRELQSAATDVYGLGALLYSLLAGQSPYAECTTLAELMAAIVQRPPVSLRRLAPGTPPDLVAVTEKCLAKKPGDRYPTAVALREDLDRVLGGGHSLASQRKSRLPALASLTLLLLALVAGAATFLTSEGETQASPSARVQPSETTPGWESLVHPLETLPHVELRSRVATLLEQDLPPATKSALRRLLRAREDLDVVKQLLADPLAAERDGRLTEWLKRYGETFPKLAVGPTRILALRRTLRAPSSIVLAGPSRVPPRVWGEGLLVVSSRQPGAGSLVRLIPSPMRLRPARRVPPYIAAVVEGEILAGITLDRKLQLHHLRSGKTWSPELDVSNVHIPRLRLRRVALCGERLLLAGNLGMVWATSAKEAFTGAAKLSLTMLPVSRADVGSGATETTGLYSLAGGDFMISVQDGGMGGTATRWDLRTKPYAGRLFQAATRVAVHADGWNFAVAQGQKIELCTLDDFDLRAPLIASDSPLRADARLLGGHPRPVRDMVYAGDLLLTTCEFDTYTDLRAWRCSDQALLAVAKVKPRHSRFMLYQGRFLVALSSERARPQALLTCWDLREGLSGGSD